MTAEQAKLWDGRADEPFDPNYHTADDTLANVNRDALDDTLPAIGYVVGQYAQEQPGIPNRTERVRSVLPN